MASDVDNSEPCVAPQNRNSVLQLPSINNAIDLSSTAMAILNEEVCGVCDNSLENDEAICDICKSSCHAACMVVSDPERCNCCGAKEMQDKLSSELEWQNADILTNQQAALPKSVGNTVSDMVVNGEPPVSVNNRRKKLNLLVLSSAN